MTASCLPCKVIFKNGSFNSQVLIIAKKSYCSLSCKEMGFLNFRFRKMLGTVLLQTVGKCLAWFFLLGILSLID